MAIKTKYNFINPTLKFCIAGLFIPGFTAIFIFVPQVVLRALGVECANSWVILWTVTTIGAVAAPVIFIRKVNKWLSGKYNLTTGKLLIFNFIEYTFLQCALTALFTTGQTFCYESDGQNGIEFVFTGWMALPVLIVLSLVFDGLRKQNNDFD